MWTNIFPLAGMAVGTYLVYALAESGLEMENWVRVLASAAIPVAHTCFGFYIGARIDRMRVNRFIGRHTEKNDPGATKRGRVARLVELWWVVLRLTLPVSCILASLFLPQWLRQNFPDATFVAWLLIALQIVLIRHITLVVREELAVRQTHRDLKALSSRWAWFDWNVIEARVQKIAPALSRLRSGDPIEDAADLFDPDFLHMEQQILEKAANEEITSVSDVS